MLLMRLLLPLLALWCLCLGPGLLGSAEVSEDGNPLVWVTVGQVGVKAEVVRTPGKLFLGLGYRQELPEGRGMLFLMPRRESQNFCMRGMKFAIDILWIDRGKLVGLEKNVSPQFPGNLTSPQPVKYVLEVPGGFADRYQVKVGAPVRW